jgi:hypothetical protein
MTTQQRLQHLAPFINGDASAYIAAELGHADALDHFFPAGDILTRAVAPKIILHIISSNTPEAGKQSLIRGLLLGSENRIKLPSAGLPEFESFITSLPAEIQALIQISTELTDEWMEDANAIIVFGSDDTIHHFRQQIAPNQIFIPHGHAVSFGIVLDNCDNGAAALAARDVSLYDQKGCLSPHCIYVRGNAKAFAEKLAVAMADFEKETPRSQLTTEEEAQIFHLRSSYRFRAASDPSCEMFESQDSSAWTIIYEDEPQFALSILNRNIFVKPLPNDLAPHIWLIADHLSTITVHPFTKETAEPFTHLGATRIAPLGQAQNPPLGWKQDGQSTLANLVTWQSIDCR